MTNGSDSNSVRKVVSVDALGRDVAWPVSPTDGSWWPSAMYKIGRANTVDAVIEPRVSGRWYERGEDGSPCDWNRALLWEPNSRLVHSWDITADWRYEPALQTEIERHFIAEADARARVQLEHRRIVRYGDRGDEMRTISAKTGDWGRLAASVETAASSAGQTK